MYSIRGEITSTARKYGRYRAPDGRSRLVRHHGGCSGRGLATGGLLTDEHVERVVCGRDDGFSLGLLDPEDAGEIVGLSVRDLTHGPEAVADEEVHLLRGEGGNAGELGVRLLVHLPVLRLAEDVDPPAGELRGEAPTPIPMRALDACLDSLREDERARVVWTHGEGAAQTIDIPQQALAQALHALIHNALDASAADKQVHVNTSIAGSEVTVEVSDQGTGMDAKTLAQAGDPFFTTKDPGRGMGLGLFLVRALVAHLGGRLQIASTLGQGTTMRVTLPTHARRTASTEKIG